jgi:hypothetical protein
LEHVYGQADHGIHGFYVIQAVCKKSHTFVFTPWSNYIGIGMKNNSIVDQLKLAE